MKRYAIWNKKDPILTPIGEVLTANQWIQRYPMAGLDTITVVCAAGEINGAFFGTLGQMIQMYENQGCDFSAYTTPEEKLAAIEDFEDACEAKARAAAEETKSTEERQTAALEAIASGATAENTAAMNALLTGEE
jgi:hypothetical protein